MALSFVQGLKEIIYADSPQFVVIKEDSLAPGTVVTMSVAITIWQGDKNTIPSPPPNTPTEANYTFTQTITADSGGDAVATFEISDYIMSIIDSDVHIPTTPGVSQFIGTGGVWVGVTAVTSITTEITPLGVFYATGGSGLFEGQNNQGTFNAGTTIAEQSGKVYGNQASRLIYNAGRNYILPVFIGAGSTNVAIDTNLGIKSFEDLGFAPADLGTTESSKQIGYITIGADVFSGWNNGIEFCYTIADYTESGIYFNGVDTYMDLGTIPGIDVNGFLEVQMKATSWIGKPPFGYNDALGTNRQFGITPQGAYTTTNIFAQTVTNAPTYNLNSAETMSTHRFEYDDPTNYNYFWATFGNTPTYQYTGTGFTSFTTSPIAFYLGGQNIGITPTPATYAEVIFTYVNAGGTIYNEANNWGGATNYGGIKVVSSDGWLTHTSAPDNDFVYCAKIMCNESRPKSIKYLGLGGAIHDFPINGRDFDTINTEKTTFNNLQINPVAGDYYPLKHVKKTFNVNSNQVATLFTGWILEQTQEMVKEMIISKLTWYEVLDQVYPSYLMDNTIRFIRRQYERQVGYDLILEIANPVLNKVT